MILYTVTVAVDPAVEDDWSSWMQNTHIPEVLATGHFVHSRTARLLQPEAEDGWPTFMIEYASPSMDAFQTYERECAPALKKDHADRYAGRVRASRTLAQTLD